MSPRKLLAFLGHSVSFGLAIAFVVVLLRPELLPTRRPQVALNVVGSPLPGPVAPAPASYAAAVSAAAPAVVNIHTARRVAAAAQPFPDIPLPRRYFGPGAGPPEAPILETQLGSGVIVNAGGYALTNYHVIAGAQLIQVALGDGRSTLATVVGSDPETDLAVLRLELEGLPSIALGSSDSLQVGDVVLAIGNPFGVGQTVTQGIVSATGRNRLGLSTFENFIQTDAAINPGNSGGALVTPQGTLVGINTAIFSRDGGSLGIGFAIPVDIARDVLTQIIEHGRVIRGWIGIDAQDLTPQLARSFDLDSTEGVIVARVHPGGPADRAGLRAGDIITRVEDQPVAGVRALLETITLRRPGSTIAIRARRVGGPVSLAVMVEQRPPPRLGER